MKKKTDHLCCMFILPRKVRSSPSILLTFERATLKPDWKFWMGWIQNISFILILFPLKIVVVRYLFCYWINQLITLNKIINKIINELCFHHSSVLKKQLSFMSVSMSVIMSPHMTLLNAQILLLKWICFAVPNTNTQIHNYTHSQIHKKYKTIQKYKYVSEPSDTQRTNSAT